MAYDPYPVATSYDNVISNCGDTPQGWYQPQPPTPILDARPPLQPLDYDEYGSTSDHGPYATSFEYHEREGGITPMEPDHDVVIEQLAREHIASDDRSRSWAEEVEMGVDWTLQGEYRLATYSPPPAPPSPAPWYPPQPPTSDHLPPQTHYTPPHMWYNCPGTQQRPRRAPYHPRTRPAPRRHPPFETRQSHMTTTRRAHFRTTTRAERHGSPRYVPPALRGDNGTSRRSSPSNPGSSEGWRDPPPHIDPPNPKPKRSDSPNWRAPSPNRPASFRNPSPPPQLPTPSASPLRPPKTVRIPPQHHTQSQLTSELIGIIKTTSETLQGIVRIAEKLIRQVNASRRLAHRPRKYNWGLHEDVLGNAPTFPPGRGESVTGSPGASEAIA
jgi:hypothetical protein